MKRSFLNLFVLGIALLFAVTKVSAQATVTATGTGPGPTAYGTLGAAFTAINGGGHTGAITITIGGGGTNEGFTPATLNASGTGLASYTSVLIKPAPSTTPTITGNLANTGVIFLNGASNVTIDGSNTAGGTTRDLTISNSTFTQQSACVRLGSVSATSGCTNDIIKNCRMNHVSNFYGICVWASSAAALATASPGPQSNNTVENCAFSSATGGVYAFGNSAATPDANWTVKGNNFTGLAILGTHLNNTSNALITGNTMDNIGQNVNGTVAAVILSFAAINATVTGNTITNVYNNYTAVPTVPLPAESAAGIWLYYGSGNVNVTNNFIANVYGYSNAGILTNGHGIVFDCPAAAAVYHNSVLMTTNQGAGFGTTAAMLIGPGATAAGSLNLRDNIFQMAQTTGTRYAIYSSVAPTVFAGIDYNDYVASSAGSFLGWITGTTCSTLGNIQTSFTSNLNSINVAPTFVSGTDLHLQVIAANNPLVAGTPIATVTTDIDGNNRSTTVPTVGADELLSTITYTSLVNTCSNGDVTLNPVTIMSPTGVPTIGPNVPRIYFRKGAGPWFSSAGTLTGGTGLNGTWTFTIGATAMGGVVAGDIISYFVVAQTTSGTIFGNPSNGLTAVDVNTITTPPTTPNTYTVNAVTLTGLTTTGNMCFNSLSATTVPFPYSGTTGSPNQYTLTWIPTGPTPVPAFVTLPASPINVNVPIALPSAVYAGLITIKNSTTGCTKQYNITLSVNPLPATVTGSTIVCIGSSTPLTSTSTGGTWTSLSPGIATIGLTTGIVTGVSGGTANIQYTLPTGCSTFTNINVVTPPGPITGPSTVCHMNSITLTNSVPGGTWSSSNPAVGSVVSTTGVVTGVSPSASPVVIGYTLTGCSPVTKLVTVNPLPNPITGTLAFCQGFSNTLASVGSGAGTWSSSVPTVATIGSSTGVVTGVSGGSSVVSYTTTSTGCSITNTVTIYPAPGPVTGGNIVCVGLTVTLGNPVGPGTWSSAFPGILMINPTTGVATGMSPGYSNVTYTTSFGCTTTHMMFVNTPPTAIAGTAVVCSESSVTLTNGTPGGTWTSSNTAIATVGSSTGVVTGVAGGVVTISYSTAACNAAIYSVTVNQTPPHITGVTTLCNWPLATSTSLFNATPGGVWSISGGASISSTGVVTGLTFGTGNVATYTMPNACFRTAPITVDTLPGVIVAIPDSICPGRSVTLTTTSTAGVWSSNNPTIAAVNAVTGEVTGMTTGSTTITYTALSTCYRTKGFRVTNPLPASVTIIRSPAMDPLCSGVPVTFTAVPVNGGATPGYEWQLFGVTISGATGGSYTYIPTHGDVIRVYMSNSDDVCAMPRPATADVPVNVYPNIVPVVNITTTSPTISYLGQPVTFFAEVTSGGTSPAYQWYVDGVAIPGATTSSFVREVYNNDTVQCFVNGNPVCATGSTGWSNKIVILGDWLKTKTLEATGGSLSLFPNPNTGTFTLTGNTGSSMSEELTVEVVNVLGQVVYSGKTIANGGAINYQVALRNNIAAGTYLLRVNGETVNDVFHFVIGE